MNQNETTELDSKLSDFLNKLIKIYANPEYKHFYPTGAPRSKVAKLVINNANVAGKKLQCAQQEKTTKEEISKLNLIFSAYRSPGDVLNNLKSYLVEDKKAAVIHFEKVLDKEILKNIGSQTKHKMFEKYQRTME